MRLVLSVAATAVLLSACSSESTAAACLPVGDEFLSAIADGTETGPLTVSDGTAIASGDSYLVAMQFDATGVSDVVGVWQTGALDGGPVFSADSYADEFTVWPLSEVDRSEINDVRDCLG